MPHGSYLVLRLEEDPDQEVEEVVTAPTVAAQLCHSYVAISCCPTSSSGKVEATSGSTLSFDDQYSPRKLP